MLLDLFSDRFHFVTLVRFAGSHISSLCMKSIKRAPMEQTFLGFPNFSFPGAYLQPLDNAPVVPGEIHHGVPADLAMT